MTDTEQLTRWPKRQDASQATATIKTDAISSPGSKCDLTGVAITATPPMTDETTTLGKHASSQFSAL
jgi:hypothetical protein